MNETISISSCYCTLGNDEIRSHLTLTLYISKMKITTYDSKVVVLVERYYSYKTLTSISNGWMI